MDTVTFFSDKPDVFIAFVAVLSLFIGSFLNVVIYRLPRMIEQRWSEECRLYLGLKPHQESDNINLCLPFSHCPACKKSIRPWHNIPVFSFIFLRGKCAYCKTPISIRYPLVELFTCISSIYVAWHFGISWQTLAALSFTWISICLIFIDLDYHLLPDELTFLLLWIGLFCSIFFVFCSSQDAIIGAIVGYLIFAIVQWAFQLVTGKTGMGQGDFKYLAALGGFLGWQLLPLIILLSSVTGILFTLIQMAIRRNFKSTPFPFGPYLAFAGWIVLIWGNEIMNYYYLELV